MSKEFAKIVTASNGDQCLFYLEPEGGDWIIHQIVNFDGVQADMKITVGIKEDATEGEEEEFEERVYEQFHLKCNTARADKLIADLAKLIEG